MTEEYEYERVEIKPESFELFRAEVMPVLKHYSPDDCMPVAIICGVGKTHVLLVGRSGLDITFSLKDYDFYIRKPKRKMVKIAQYLYKETDGPDWRIGPSAYLCSEKEAVEQCKDLGLTLVKWPYGEIIEVPEGES